MKDRDATSAPTLTPRRVIVQAIGFAVGLALLGWCISSAVQGGDWDRVLEADPLLVLGLMGCTVACLGANGAIFWLTIQPIKPLRLDHMQYLNLVTSVLNYAPVRAGLIARVAYHLKVDRFNLLQIGGWFFAVAATLFLALGACVGATIIRPHIDLLWVALVLGQIVLGGFILQALMSHPLIVRHGRGMDQMLRQPACLWGALGLRLIDIGAFAGRMACAAAILELDLSGSQVLLLAFAALALTLNPLGRVGYREVGVAFFAAFLGMSGEELDARRNQLALIESAGEALVAVPLGSLALLWYRHRWRQAKEENPPPPQPDDAVSGDESRG